jgi:hypothetical protein
MQQPGLSTQATPETPENKDTKRSMNVDKSRVHS